MATTFIDFIDAPEYGLFVSRTLQRKRKCIAGTGLGGVLE